MIPKAVKIFHKHFKLIGFLSVIFCTIISLTYMLSTRQNLHLEERFPLIPFYLIFLALIIISSLYWSLSLIIYTKRNIGSLFDRSVKAILIFKTCVKVINLLCIAFVCIILPPSPLSFIGLIILWSRPFSIFAVTTLILSFFIIIDIYGADYIGNRWNNDIIKGLNWSNRELSIKNN